MRRSASVFILPHTELTALAAFVSGDARLKQSKYPATQMITKRTTHVAGEIRLLNPMLIFSVRLIASVCAASEPYGWRWPPSSLALAQLLLENA